MATQASKHNNLQKRPKGELGDTVIGDGWVTLTSGTSKGGSEPKATKEHLFGLPRNVAK